MAEVITLRAAEDDLYAIHFRLFERSEERAEAFSQSIDRLFFDLGQFPELGRPIGGGFRRKLVTGFFHYGIFYSIEGERVMIHAVLDLRQDPEAIRRRLES